MKFRSLETLFAQAVLASVSVIFLYATMPAVAQVQCVDTNDVKYLQPPNLAGLDVLNSGPWVLADDFICTNTGPISDIHIWGSWLNDKHGTITNFWLGIYDDVPANPNNPTNSNSHPGNLLWSESFPVGQFAESIWSASQESFLDPGPPAIIGLDTNAWYYCFYPTNPFTQSGSRAAPKTYWIAAYAQVPTVVGAPTPQYGWKTTGFVQHDTSVHTPWPGFLPGTNTSWMTNAYQPPPGGPLVPLDLAFKLETPTNTPPSTLCTDTNDGVKYLQPPNLQGLDVWNSGPWMLADDFICTQSGPVSDIHIWGSWLSDSVRTNSLTFTLGIYDDVPVGPNNTNSHPGNLLWQQTFAPGQYAENLFATGSETFLDPGPPVTMGTDSEAWYYCFYPTNPFVQTGTNSAPKTYWLAAYAQLPPGSAGYDFGWKTTDSVQNDTSVHATWPGSMPTNNPGWIPTGYRPPTGGPLIQLDLAFMLTTKTNCCPVSITYISTNMVVVTWACGVLQSSTNLTGPYADVLGATSPYTNSTVAPPYDVFYRTQCN